MNQNKQKEKLMSVCIPTYDMNGLGGTFLKHSFDILTKQTFVDFDVVITDNSENDSIKNLCEKYKNKLDIKYYKNESNLGMTKNVNRSIKKATGKLIKILFQDDFLYDEKSLENIVKNFNLEKDNWLVTACEHSKDGITFYRPFYPKYNNKIYLGNNTISSPSVLTIKNENPLLFDENLIWLMDCDYYKRCYEKFGYPKIINKICAVNRTGPHQTTNTTATESLRKKEFKYIIKKYNTNKLYNYKLSIKKRFDQLCEIVDFMKWHKKFNYKKGYKKNVDIIWGKVDTIGSITVPIDMLYANIYTKFGKKTIPIDETPHYNWIKNLVENTNNDQSQTRYYNYIKRFFPNEDSMLQIEKIKKMVLLFKKRDKISCEIVVNKPTYNKNFGYKVLIYDGNHRASIMKALKYKTIRCLIIKK